MTHRDDDDFTRIFEEHYAGVCRFLEGMIGGRRGIAQELAQECFLRFYRTSSESIPATEARFWLYRVARNLALNEIKRGDGRRLIFAKIAEIFRPRDMSPEDNCERGEAAGSVRCALASLPEHQRAILLLREGEELSYAEIAKTLGITGSKVKVDIFRARQALRAKWKATATKNVVATVGLCDKRAENGC
jgi:RNA polymerase sigma-70 factor (ECF subfamily)